MPLISEKSSPSFARSEFSPPRTDFSLSNAACILLLLAVWAAVYIPGLASPGLLDDADSVHADAAVHMAQTGDYVTLYANNVRYLEKAPLTYWAVALTYR